MTERRWLLVLGIVVFLVSLKAQETTFQETEYTAKAVLVEEYIDIEGYRPWHREPRNRLYVVSGAVLFSASLVYWYKTRVSSDDNAAFKT